MGADWETTPTQVDVAICGGGLAGLTLARHLRREIPELSVAILDALERPLPEAAFKVGESSTEIGSYYLAGVLGLEGYLEETQLPKLGFRFFFENGCARFEDRPEFGIVDFPIPSSYNFDRGILENDLRSFTEQDGALLLEGVRIHEIELAEDGRPHRVSYQPAGGGHASALRARWVVDAMGRRRMLQGQLELGRRRASTCNAAWFRLSGRIDVGELVPASAEAWHERVPGGRRYYSANHLVGDGYWVWLIPLPSGHTSIGIVALDDVHRHTGFNRWSRAQRWLARHEPHLAAYLHGRKPLDFQCVRDYSRSSRRIFSEQRWACIGDAAVFADPLYASALDILGFENTAVVELIRLDREGQLDRQTAGYFNRAVVGMNDALTANIQHLYRLFSAPVPAMAKITWDTAVAWGLLAPRMFNGLFQDRELTARVNEITSRSFFLIERMQALFLQWKEKSARRLGFDFFCLLEIPHLRALRRRSLVPGKSRETLLADHTATMETLEELAQILFLLAIEDTLPEQLPQFAGPVWLNAWAVSLKPEVWERDGLFQPTSEPRSASLAEGLRAVRALLRPRDSDAQG